MDWTLDPLFGSYALIGLATLGLLIIVLLVQESNKLTSAQKWILWLLRLGMCIVLILFLLRPGLTFTRQSTPESTIAILTDETSSMELPSGEGKTTRWDEQLAIVESLWSARSKFGVDCNWASYAYGKQLRPLGTFKSNAEALSITQSKPISPATDIGGPLAQLLTITHESPLSAVVWIGDGTQTQSPAGGDPLQVSRRLAQLDIPLYVMAVGPRADSENSRDLSLEGVPEQLDAFTKNNLVVNGSVRCRGVANQEIEAHLLLRNESGAPKELSRIRIRPTKSDETIPIQLPLVAPDAGAYELILRVDPVERESVAQNNESTVYLNVRAGGARILYIEGEARMEMKFLRRAIDESSDLKLDVFPIYKPPIQKWPVDLSEKLAGEVYDCIILGDVDYSSIEQAGASKIADSVRNGVGLITLGGYHSYSPGGWNQSALRDLLPIQMQQSQRMTLENKVNLQDHIAGPNKLTMVGSPELLQIASPDQNASIWNELKPLQDMNRWGPVKNAPGTVVIATNQRNDPMIVVGNADKGRVISSAVDSTFLWARQGQLAAHKAFWRKLVYWCMRRHDVAAGIQLRMPRRRLGLEETSELVLDWNGGSKQAEMPMNISLHLWKLGSADPFADTQPKDIGTVALSKRDNASMRASFQGTKEPGRYEWRAQSTLPDGSVVESTLPFVVSDSSIETLQPTPDWTLLEQMAKLNATAGGRLLSPDQKKELVEQLLERRNQSTEKIVETRKLGEGLLDSWTAFFVLGGLMIAQWGLRKKWGLP